MSKLSKKALIERLSLQDLNNSTWSNPENWSGDVEFGTCDLTGAIGNLEPMQVLDSAGNVQNFKVLEEVAYKLHGLAGAY